MTLVWRTIWHWHGRQSDTGPSVSKLQLGSSNIFHYQHSFIFSNPLILVRVTVELEHWREFTNDKIIQSILAVSGRKPDYLEEVQMDKERTCETSHRIRPGMGNSNTTHSTTMLYPDSFCFQSSNQISTRYNYPCRTLNTACHLTDMTGALVLVRMLTNVENSDCQCLALMSHNQLTSAVSFLVLQSEWWKGLFSLLIIHSHNYFETDPVSSPGKYIVSLEEASLIQAE